MLFKVNNGKNSDYTAIIKLLMPSRKLESNKMIVDDIDLSERIFFALNKDSSKFVGRQLANRKYKKCLRTMFKPPFDWIHLKLSY